MRYSTGRTYRHPKFRNHSARPSLAQVPVPKLTPERVRTWIRDLETNLEIARRQHLNAAVYEKKIWELKTQYPDVTQEDVA